MEENTAKLIEQLANKLGTTSEYLWKVFLKQAPIDATITLVQDVIIVIFGIILYKLHKKFLKKKEIPYRSSMYDDNEFLRVAMAAGAFIFIIIAAIAFFCFGDIVNGYFNPEYWALNKILPKASK